MTSHSASLDETPFRDRFVVHDERVAYLDGNSLGRLPKQTAQRIEEVVNQQWGTQLIAGWNADWLSLASRIGDKIGQLIGAEAGATVVCDSTSINLYKLAWSLLRSARGRVKIITDQANFPSDIYILAGLAEHLSADGFQLQVLDFAGCDALQISQQLEHAIDDQTALVSLSHVHYQSGYAFDMSAITSLAHRRGARVLWDLSHSVGAMPIELAAANVDAAVGCTYKYLNGGPGAPAFLYVAPELCASLENPLRGWFGAASPFDFSPQFQPHPGTQRFTVGTPPVLSLAAVEPGVDLTLAAGIDYLRTRSLLLSDYLLAAAERRLVPLGYKIQTPRLGQHRGSHVSIGHAHAWQITQAIIDRHAVIPDFRGPDTIRLGITPLYTTRDEIDRAVEALEVVVVEQQYQDFPATRTGVT